MDTYISNRLQHILFILSLCLHTLALILLFMIIHPLHEQIINQFGDEQTHDVQSVLSQGTQPGAQIMFQDEPDTTTDNKSAQYSSSQTTTSAQPTLHPHEQPSSAIVSDIVPDIDTTTMSDDSPETSADNESHTIPAPLSRLEQLPITMPTSFFDDIPYVDNHTTPTTASQSHTPTTAHKRTAKRTTTQRGPSIQRQHAAAQLRHIAQGFIRSVEQDYGTAPSPQTDMKALALQIYSSKVFRQLEQSINTEKKFIHLLGDIKTNGSLYLTLSKEGKLLKLILDIPRKTVDISTLEEACFIAATRVGLYQPIPQSLNTDVITLTCKFGINLDKGFTSFRLTHH